jgi:serine/threonine-protein kinase RsbW
LDSDAGAPASLVLTVPSRTEFLSLVRDLTRRAAELGGFAAGAAQELGLAVDECATNVIRHAYQGAPDGELEVRVEHRGVDFRVEVLDSGRAIDPARLPEVDLERYAQERRQGGLGVHLMGRIMDSVSYGRASRRNVCSLVKRKAGGGR